MVVKKNQAPPTGEMRSRSKRAREGAAVELAVVAALDADDHHVGELVALELRERRHLHALAAQTPHQALGHALAEHDVGELVVADVELDGVEVAGVVDVAALLDRELALGGDEPAGRGRALAGLVAEMRDHGLFQVAAALAIRAQDLADEGGRDGDRQIDAVIALGWGREPGTARLEARLGSAVCGDGAGRKGRASGQ